MHPHLIERNELIPEKEELPERLDSEEERRERKEERAYGKEYSFEHPGTVVVPSRQVKDAP